MDGAGKLLTTKVPSTPGDFSRGMMDALGAGAQALGVKLDDFCRDIAFLSHGTTVGTNTIIQKKGARVGLITTKGHEDAIHIMRGSRGYTRARHPQGGAFPGNLQAGADRAEAPDPRRVRARGLLRRGRGGPE